MKKILIGLFALSLMSGTSVFAIGGKKKSKKAKASCVKVCTEKKDCSTHCVPMPGCCKM